MSIEIEPNSDETLKIFDEVLAERIKQDAQWGEQNHNPAEWCMILGEEVGEVNRAALEHRFETLDEKDLVRLRCMRIRDELIQVAAVAVAMVESLDRNELKR